MRPIALLFAALSGCATTQQVGEANYKRWVGKPAEEFVRAYGPPHGRYETQFGGHIMQWRLGVSSQYVPGTTVVTTQTIGGVGFGNATTYGGGIAEHFCDVRIETSAKGIIMDFSIPADTYGELGMSRCAEVLK